VTRIRTRWLKFACHGEPTGLRGEPEWPPYNEPDSVCLLIDRQDAVAGDIDTQIRATWGTQVLNFR